MPHADVERHAVGEGVGSGGRIGERSHITAAEQHIAVGAAKGEQQRGIERLVTAQVRLVAYTNITNLVVAHAIPDLIHEAELVAGSIARAQTKVEAGTVGVVAIGGEESAAVPDVEGKFLAVIRGEVSVEPEIGWFTHIVLADGPTARVEVVAGERGSVEVEANEEKALGKYGVGPDINNGILIAARLFEQRVIGTTVGAQPVHLPKGVIDVIARIHRLRNAVVGEQ